MSTSTFSCEKCTNTEKVFAGIVRFQKKTLDTGYYWSPDIAQSVSVHQPKNLSKAIIRLQNNKYVHYNYFEIAQTLQKKTTRYYPPVGRRPIPGMC